MRSVFLLLVLISSTLLWAGSDDEWHYYGGDAGNSHYSRLTQINKSNVQNLQPAWEWKTGEGPMPQYGTAPSGMEGTPLMIDGVLYIVTSFNKVVALDPETGKEIWNYDPHAYERPGRLTFHHRGIATWTDGKQRRLFLNTRGHMVALDPRTGKPIPTFGSEGIVDMLTNLSKTFDRNQYENTSPPVVYGNVVMSGNTVWDGWIGKDTPPGDVQAFDVKTGKRIWDFHTIAQKGEFGNDTWENGSWQVTGHANVWVPFTVDEKRGLVYLPVSTPSNDHFGGNRKGNGLFGDSIVCLDAKTGKRVWHFQTVHHNLWDYDGSSTPTLLTIHVNGKTIDAVAAPSKTGFVYVFDRVTGTPVWPIEERPVRQSDVAGEQTSPTQPFPSKPPAFAKQGVTEDDIVDFTPEIRAMAMEKIKGYRFGGIFNPPSLEGSLMLPGNGGGANWGGGSADLDKGIFYVKAKNLLRVIKLTKQDPATPHDPLYTNGVTEGPYKYDFPVDLTMANGLFLNKPPYGTLTAIDLNKGEILWQVPVGDIARIHNNPLLKGVNIGPTGAIGNEGTLVTSGGLLFIGPGDNKLYALDQETGKVLWAGELPYTADATPMTYRTKTGRQFVVVGTGGGRGASLQAFALPQ